MPNQEGKVWMLEKFMGLTNRCHVKSLFLKTGGKGDQVQTHYCQPQIQNKIRQKSPSHVSKLLLLALTILPFLPILPPLTSVHLSRKKLVTNNLTFLTFLTFISRCSLLKNIFYEKHHYPSYLSYLSYQVSNFKLRILWQTILPFLPILPTLPGVNF